ncbi:YycH family regulatory protein [Halobacillus andaensis]|uniref:YycH family regulatory protein n=1 Tax=Halobacillus andaensis TaxID=1176239 RepID=UPI003D71F5F7
MNVETLKSIILVILIGFSLLLTVALWNFQPEYESLEKEEGLIEETTIGGEEQEVSSIVRPSQFVFHQSGDHYDFEDAEDIELTYSSMKNWTIRNFRSTESQDPPTGEEAMVEVIFPTEVPAQAIPDIFTFDDSEMEPPSGQFNRIFITLNTEGNNAELLFTSDQAGSTSFRASIGSSDAAELSNMMNDDDLLRENIMFDGDEEKRIFIPKERVELPEDQIDSTEIGLLPLTNELFGESPVVREHSSSTSDQRLTDYSNRLEVLGDGNRLEFTKLNSSSASGVQTALSSFDLLNNSMDFVNTHEGWTDTFHLTSLNPSTSMAQFHMYFNDLPLLESSDGLHKIEVKYDGEELARYMRPLRDFDTSFPPTGSTQELPSGESVASYLMESRQYNMNLIEDIQIGYTLEPQDAYEVYKLEPAWFVLENGSWKEISDVSPAEEGGVSNAMGSN